MFLGAKRATSDKQYAAGHYAANERCIAHREHQLTRFNQYGMELRGIRDRKGHGREICQSAAYCRRQYTLYMVDWMVGHLKEYEGRKMNIHKQ
jgi:hypothetical protein